MTFYIDYKKLFAGLNGQTQESNGTSDADQKIECFGVTYGVRVKNTIEWLKEKKARQ